jgi:transposase
VIERLPAYAPELNSVEGLWSSSRPWSWPTSPAQRWPR